MKQSLGAFAKQSLKTKLQSKASQQSCKARRQGKAARQSVRAKLQSKAAKPQRKAAKQRYRATLQRKQPTGQKLQSYASGQKLQGKASRQSCKATQQGKAASELDPSCRSRGARTLTRRLDDHVDTLQTARQQPTHHAVDSAICLQEPAVKQSSSSVSACSSDQLPDAVMAV